MKFPTTVIVLSVFLTGCVSSGLGPRGEIKPSSFAATATRPAIATGIVGGGLIGGALGEQLSGRERRLGVEAEYRALEATPAGETVAWGEKNARRKGTVRAAQPYRVGSQDCRQYTHILEIDGVSREARGTACRNEDGSWTLLS